MQPANENNLALGAPIQALAGRAGGELSPDEQQAINRLTDFYDPVALGKCLTALGYDFHDELEILVGIAKNGDRDSARLSAMRMIRSLTEQSLRTTGLITSTETRAKMMAPDGRTLEFRNEATTMAARARQTSEAALRLAAPQVTVTVNKEEESDHAKEEEGDGTVNKPAARGGTGISGLRFGGASGASAGRADQPAPAPSPVRPPSP